MFGNKTSIISTQALTIIELTQQLEVAKAETKRAETECPRTKADADWEISRLQARIGQLADYLSAIGIDANALSRDFWTAKALERMTLSIQATPADDIPERENAAILMVAKQAAPSAALL